MGTQPIPPTPLPIKKPTISYDLIGRVLDDVSTDLLDAAAAAVSHSASLHPSGASCSCGVLEALAVLYENGYRLVRNEQ